MMPMKYVYILQSLKYPTRRYVGMTGDLENRLVDHNSGKSPHTSKYLPWQIIVYIGMEDDNKAVRFEKYLKSGSGRAFASKHFW
jgi:putative endonuclease